MNERVVHWLCIMTVDLACIAGGVYLVMTEHYGWAWIPFVALFSTNFDLKDESKSSGSADK